MAKYPKEVIEAGKAAKYLFDVAQGTELEARVLKQENERLNQELVDLKADYEAKIAELNKAKEDILSIKQDVDKAKEDIIGLKKKKIGV